MLKLRRLFASASIICALGASSIQAQSSCSHQAACGAVISANLDFSFGTCLDAEVRRYDLYSFQANSGQVLSILARSSFFPPALLLLDDQNVTLTRDENPTQASVSGVSYKVLRAGTYTVAVRNVNVGDGGPYTLQIGCTTSNEPPPPPPPPPPLAVQVSPSSVRVNRGTSVGAKVITKLNDFEAPVVLSVSGVPTGMTASIEPALIPSPGEGEATLTVNVSTEATVGANSLTVTAQGGDKAAQQDFFIDVTSVCVSPIILGTQPGNHVVFEGFRARLNVDPSGTSPFSFQWYEGPSGFRGSPVADATSPTFVTPPINGHAMYWVEVRNICGVSSSATATITTEPAPPRLRPVRR